MLPLPHKRRRGERGYILLTLLLIVAMMAIVALATVPTLKFNMRRDREEEMIHRGVQYSNAIRRFYKKFGRYPTKIEDLENTSGIKFLRKRYKDPMNCKAGKCEDFKLLHYSDVQTALGSFGGGTIPGASPIGGAAGANGASAFGSSSSSFGGQSSAFGQSSSAFGGQSSSLFGSNGSGSNSPFGQSSQSGQGQQQNGQSNDSSTPDANGGSGNTGSPGDNNSSNSPGTSGSNPNQLGSGQIIGGPIVGVASGTKSDENTIREFNKKKKYKDWMFIYDPMQDQGRLITTPYQPQMQGLGQAPNVNGQNGTNGTGSGFGSSPFSNSPSGFQNSPGPNSPSGGAFGGSNQPSNPPQQQQQ